MPTLQPADGACVMQAPGSYASTACDFANPIVFATIRYTAYASADCSGAGNAGPTMRQVPCFTRIERR